MQMSDVISNILAIDSATSILRVGLSVNSDKLFEAANSDRFRHAEFIFTLIEDVLKKGATDKSKIDSIIIGTGPGSFTGLRVGMASAKALAVSLNIPLVGISLFSAVAPRLFREYGPAAVLIPSRKNEYYIGRIESADFKDREISVVTADKLCEPSDLPPLLGIDCDLNQLPNLNATVIPNSDFKIGIADLVERGSMKLKESGADDIARLEPLYIQDFKTGKIK